MFDIGLGEFIALAVIALIVFGPDRLPKAAAQGGRALRQLREMAANARKELGDSAGLDTLSEEWKSLQELHPKRIIASALDSPAATPASSATASNPPASSPPAASPPVAGAAAADAPTGGAAAADPATSSPAVPPAPAPGAAAAPAAAPTPPPAAGYDPDAT